MTARPGIRRGAGFFDMQAAVGVTKHMGGLEATRELLALCHVRADHEVLDVGCGIGVGAACIAKTFGCRVVGVDLSERMIGWARRRARQERVGALIQLCTADVLALPFPDDRFDVVVCESVLAFVEDKTRAIGECVRVTKPGGRVGLNEGLWVKDPPPEMVERVKDAIGPSMPAEEFWRSLWAASGLQDRVVQIKHADPRAEIKSRIRWIGWRWMLRAWGRALRLYVTDPAIRQSLKQQFSVPPDVFRFAGYGLFAGRKGQPDDPQDLIPGAALVPDTRGQIATPGLTAEGVWLPARPDGSLWIWPGPESRRMPRVRADRA
jgi:SAM-dependent methyltransferase